MDESPPHRSCNPLTLHLKVVNYFPKLEFTASEFGGFTAEEIISGGNRRLISMEEADVSAASPVFGNRFSNWL